MVWGGFRSFHLLVTTRNHNGYTELPLPTSLCRQSRQKYWTSAKLNLLSGRDTLTIFFSLWRTERKEIDEFIALANRHHPSIKFTAEISDKEINFLDTTVYKGERFHNQGIIDIRTHFKPTETFQYTHFSFCNPHRVRKGLIKGESLGLLRSNSSAKSFYENIYNFKKGLSLTI